MHTDNRFAEEIAENLRRIWTNIGAAARRAGRNPAGVTLVAVTKNVGVEAVRAAITNGAAVLGENRVQEAAEKFKAIGRSAEWHFIGHLQKNKVKHALEIFSLIHSVDSWELAAEIDRKAELAGMTVPVLLQVNVAEETSKHGVPPLEAENVARRISALRRLRLSGLMAIPPYDPDPEKSRPHFRRLVEIRNGIALLKLENTRLNILSFGMTGDYEVAVEEGATHLRIGTGIFGERKT